jgi:hypothetical protein
MVFPPVPKVFWGVQDIFFSGYIRKYIKRASNRLSERASSEALDIFTSLTNLVPRRYAG